MEAFSRFGHLNAMSVDARLYFVAGTQANPTPTFNLLFVVPTASGNTLFRERQIQFAARFEF